MIDRVILFKNAVETLGYFSEQIALELEHQGFDTYFIDYNNMFQTIDYLPKFAKRGSTAMITFNFVGLSQEDVFLEEKGKYIWEKYHPLILNILVDHPLYYHSKLEKVKGNMILFCIDREHVTYIKRFYPNIRVQFLPIAGNVRADINLPFLGNDALEASSGVKYRDYEAIWDYEDELLPIEDRPYDIVFTANYVPMQNVYRSISAADEEYQKFYDNILADLIEDPSQSVDTVMERHIQSEIGNVSQKDLKAAMGNMFFIDLCIRTYFRSEIIRKLTDADLKVQVFGADWNLLDCKKPWNLVQNGGQVKSKVCVQAMRNAKISLNVLPWFKDGAHDRVFTSMLQKSVALTDDSKYLHQEFTDGEDAVFYLLNQLDDLAEDINRLLAHPDDMQRIADAGYQKASKAHNWRERTKILIKELM